MDPKIILFLLIGISIGCSSSKHVVITTQKPVGWKYSKSRSSSDQAKTPSQVTKNSVAKPLVINQTVKEYITQYNAVAMSNMNAYGIPASIILAQGILESGAGKGDLAVNANNHFGIKCHNDWIGDKVYKDDDSLQECFRKYNYASESYQDHAMVLTGKKRYSKLFKLPKDDYKAWAKGLRDAGYATDPKYPDKLIAYIELYNLNQYDNKKVVMNDNFNSGENSWYEIQKGDTFYSVSKKFNLTIDELKEKNNLIENTLSIGQKLIVK